MSLQKETVTYVWWYSDSSTSPIGTESSHTAPMLSRVGSTPRPATCVSKKEYALVLAQETTSARTTSLEGLPQNQEDARSFEDDKDEEDSHPMTRDFNTALARRGCLHFGPAGQRLGEEAWCNILFFRLEEHHEHTAPHARSNFSGTQGTADNQRHSSLWRNTVGKLSQHRSGERSGNRSTNRKEKEKAKETQISRVTSGDDPHAVQ